MSNLSHLLLSAMLVGCSMSVMAQRQVTPVETDDKKPPSPTLHYYDKHGELLKEPVLFLAELDTATNTSVAARPIYPRLHAIDFGLNFFDGILAIAGQKHGGADIWASLSMWNWLFPTVEAGIGIAHNTPNPGNFTYKGKPSPYFKIGADYNFLYKSNPDYRVMLGVRAAYSPFSFDVENITIDSPYWDESSNISLSGCKSQALWGEVLAGLKVNIWRHWSLGWTFRYHFLFGDPENDRANPWYIPGFGAKNSKINVTFSLIYTLPLHKKESTTLESLDSPTE